MSRRKHLAKRGSTGRILTTRAPSELLPPTEIRRLMEGAASGLRDASWGTMLGRIYLSGKISASEFAAAKHWSAITIHHSEACLSPRPPRSVSFDATGGSPADPASAAGQKQARQDARAVKAYLDGRYALSQAGLASERAVEAVVIADQAPCGYAELEALRDGLRSLRAWWTASARARSR